MMHKLYVPLAIYHRLQAYGKATPYEVSGLGMITQLENRRDFRIMNVMLFKQKASPGETKLDTEDVSAWMVEAVVQNVPLQNVRLWWHFHMGGNPHWSRGTSNQPADEEQIESWNGQCSWMVSLLLTKDGPMVARLDIYNPVRTTIGLEIVVEAPPMDEGLVEACAAEVKEKVETAPTEVRYVYPWLGREVDDEWVF